jgi:hypothetical protein
MGESGYSLIDEMCTLITGQTLRASKLSDDVLKNKPGCIYVEKSQTGSASAQQVR